MYTRREFGALTLAGLTLPRLTYRGQGSSIDEARKCVAFAKQALA